MAAGIGTVQVKRMRGKLNVVGLGRTPRGQKFIKQTIELKAETIHDEKFKEELSTAVDKLFD